MRALGKTSTVCKEAGVAVAEAGVRVDRWVTSDKHWKLVPAGKEVIPGGNGGP